MTESSARYQYFAAFVGNENNIVHNAIQNLMEFSILFSKYIGNRLWF